MNVVVRSLTQLLHRLLAPLVAETLATLAVVLARRDQPHLALRLLDDAVRIAPTFACYRIALSRLQLRMGRAQEAQANLAAALALKPSSEPARDLLCSARLATGDIDGAERLLEGYEGRRNLGVLALRNLGIVKQMRGERDAALHWLRAAVARDPRYAPAHNSLGLIEQERGHLAEAAQCYRRALELDDRFLPAYINLGKLAVEQGALDEAEQWLGRALQLDDANPDLLINVGILRLKGKQFDAALDYFTRAGNLVTDEPLVFLGLGAACRGLHRLDEAVAHYQRAIELDPRRGEAFAGLGTTCYDMGQFEEAERNHRIALELKPDYPEAWNDFGVVQQELRHYDEAIGAFDRALELNPRLEVACWHRALTYLTVGDYRRGWEDYEARARANAVWLREFDLPVWEGEALAGRTLLVYAEQGLGDEIMFASCLPDLITGDGRYVIDCAPKLGKLFERSFPGATIHASDQRAAVDWLDRLAPVDCVIPAGSLPRLFRSERAAFPQHSGYLKADPQRIAYWRQRLAELGPGLKVGIAWTGGVRKTRRQWRSIPLGEWGPILQQGGVHFVSLQYTPCADELAELQQTAGLSVHHWQEAIDDYDETAALVCALDLVISVQTAVVHLCGALGRPAWVLVRFSPEWRYGSEGEEMPWYPSVRLIRQQRIGDWRPVVETAAYRLQALRDESHADTTG